MKQFKSSDLKTLIEHRGYPSISIYVPTHTCGDYIRQDPIRLKNLLYACRDRLESQWPCEKVLEFLRDGLNFVHDGLFWSYQHAGLVLFLAPHFSEHYQLRIAPQEKLYIGNSLYVLPLIKLLSSEKAFYILLVRQSGNRLWKANYDSINEVELPDVPKNIDEILQYDVVEEQREIHTMPMGKIDGSGAMFHSQGNIADDAHHKKNVERYLKEVARKVDKHLQGQTAPLVLAGVEYEKAMYRQCSSYRHISKEGLLCNGGRLDIQKLRKSAWKIVEPSFNKDIDDCLAMYRQLSNTNRTSTNIEAILPAAYTGRVETLLVDTGKRIGGQFDTELQRVKIHKSERAGDEDLLNLAVIYALRNDAKVCAVTEEQGFKDKPIAAVFRY